jgi:type IV pilus assembly protein PilM
MAKTLGIDIGTTSVKIVEGNLSGANFSIERAVIAPIQQNAISSSDQAVLDDTAIRIKTALKQGGFKERNAIVSLSEQLIFTRIVELPPLSDRELKQSLQWEAERYIPLPLSEVSMDYQILTKKNERNSMELLLVASPTKVITMYTSLLESAGVQAAVLENESSAIPRIFKKNTEQFLLLDLGGSFSTIVLFAGDIIRLVRTIPVGGDVITKALVSAFNQPYQQAESFKMTYGLSPDSSGTSNLQQIIMPFLDTISNELLQSAAYGKQRYPSEVLSAVYITGGGAAMPGLCDYISSKIQITTEIGNPWKNCKVGNNLQKEYTGRESLFTVATGLAMRGYE